jgi:hypothetical protein
MPRTNRSTCSRHWLPADSFNTLLVGQAFFGTLVPLLLLGLLQIVRKRVPVIGRERMYFISSILILLGVFAMRWNVVIGGQLFSKSPARIHHLQNGTRRAGRLGGVHGVTAAPVLHPDRAAEVFPAHEIRVSESQGTRGNDDDDLTLLESDDRRSLGSKRQKKLILWQVMFGKLWPVPATCAETR